MTTYTLSTDNHVLFRKLAAIAGLFDEKHISGSHEAIADILLFWLLWAKIGDRNLDDGNVDSSDLGWDDLSDENTARLEAACEEVLEYLANRAANTNDTEL